MKQSLLLRLLVGLCALTGFIACDKLDDTITTTPSRDCIVTSAIIGSVPRDVYCIGSRGQDSVYSTTVKGSDYAMVIDQINRRIYNTDSLPKGSRIDRLVFSTFASSGTTSIKSLTTGTDTIYSPSDSTDFSVEREITVFSPSNTSRTYRVQVFAHKEEGDSVALRDIYTIGSGSPLAEYTDCRALSDGDYILVYGSKADGSVSVIKTLRKAPDFTQSLPIDPINGVPLNLRSVRTFKGSYYALFGDILYSSPDGINDWKRTGKATDNIRFRSLAGSSKDSLYAGNDGKLYSSSDGETWQVSEADGYAPLPISDLQLESLPSRLGNNYEQLLLYGTTAEGKPAIWVKTVDLKNEYNFPWTDLPQESNTDEYKLPAFRYATLAVYDHCYLLGGMEGGRIASPRMSYDGGRSWPVGDVKTPVTLIGITAIGMTVDKDGYIWFVPTGAGSVYKGRHNRVGWATIPKEFQRPIRP